ncbi:MAG: glycosyltransferase family 4 protein [Synechococcaceae cyanobacterium ELA739]
MKLQDSIHRKSLHVAILCRSLTPPNSVANVALHHAKELAAQGIQVSLLSDSLPKKGLLKKLAAGVTGHEFHTFRFDALHRFGHLPTVFAFSITGLLALRRLDRRQSIDALIVHSHPDGALVGRWWNWRRRRPYALVSHGVVFDRPPGTYDPLLSWLYRITTRPAFASADLVVALSPAMAALAKDYGARASRIRLIPNGIEASEIGLDQSPSSAQAPTEDVFRLLFIGTLAPVKGLDVLLHACAWLHHQDFAFSLSLIGSGSPAALASYRSLALELGLADRVDFLGLIPRQRLGSHYQQHHLMVIPSRSDPLPTVVLEAMLAGCPVLGAAVGGIPFLLENGVAGTLVQPESATALAQAITGLAADPHRRLQIADRARSVAQQKFSWGQCGLQLADGLYELFNLK